MRKSCKGNLSTHVYQYAPAFCRHQALLKHKTSHHLQGFCRLVKPSSFAFLNFQAFYVLNLIRRPRQASMAKAGLQLAACKRERRQPGRAGMIHSSATRGEPHDGSSTPADNTTSSQLSESLQPFFNYSTSGAAPVPHHRNEIDKAHRQSIVST